MNMDFNNYNQYENIPKYTGKDTFYVTNIFNRTALIVCLISFIVFYLIIGSVIWNSQNVELIFFPLYMGAISIGGFLYFIIINFRRIRVSDEEIVLLNIFGNSIKHFEWDNIENIYVPIGLSSLASDYKFYISTNPFKTNGSEWRYTAISPEYIVMKYNPKIIHCIIQYWDKKIDNYDEPKSWQRYIARIQGIRGKE